MAMDKQKTRNLVFPIMPSLDFSRPNLLSLRSQPGIHKQCIQYMPISGFHMSIENSRELVKASPRIAAASLHNESPCLTPGGYLLTN